MSFLSELEKYLIENVNLDRKQVPIEILKWADEKLYKKINSHIRLIQKGTIKVDIPWHEADREYYQMFKLVSNNKAIEVPFSFTRSGMEGDGAITGKEIGGETEIPSGFVMAVVGTYPPRLEIYTASDASKFLPDISTEVSDEEFKHLYYKQSLISSARPRVPEEIHQSLLQKGLIKANGGISNSGKNVVNNSPERLKKMRGY